MCPSHRDCFPIATGHSSRATGSYVDGRVLADGDVVLLARQTAGSQNGAWVVGTPPTRPSAAYVNAPGMLFFVSAGATHSGTLFLCTAATASVVTLMPVLARTADRDAAEERVFCEETLRLRASTFLPTATGSHPGFRSQRPTNGPPRGPSSATCCRPCANPWAAFARSPSVSGPRRSDCSSGSASSSSPRPTPRRMASGSCPGGGAHPLPDSHRVGTHPGARPTFRGLGRRLHGLGSDRCTFVWHRFGRDTAGHRLWLCTAPSESRVALDPTHWQSVGDVLSVQDAARVVGTSSADVDANAAYVRGRLGLDAASPPP